MKIDFPIPAQYGELVMLWQEAFGDTEEFIDGFFCTAFSPARCRCIASEEDMDAALYWMDLTLEDKRYAYIYAVAVAKRCRGRSLCAQLMADTREHLKLRGYDGILLVPQDESLRTMYAKMGYRDCTQVMEFPGEPAGEPLNLQRIGRDTYHALRQGLLPQGSVVEAPEGIAFLETMAFFYRGEGVLLAAHARNGVLWCPEYLGDRALAGRVLTALNCREGHFRTPGEGVPYAMFLPLTDDVPTPAYLSLCFD